MRRLFAFALICFAGSVLAQSSQDYESPMPANTITITGEATVSAPPDRALVQFSVDTEGRGAAETLHEHEERVQQVLTAVRNLGIADRQIQLNWVGLHGRGNGREIFKASRSVTITVDDLRLVPELVVTVVEQGSNRLHGVWYTLQNPQRYEDQALRGAVERARERALIIAAASGTSLGRVHRVHEGSVRRSRFSAIFGAGRALSADGDGTPGAYSAGSSEVHASVSVTFELIQ